MNSFYAHSTNANGIRHGLVGHLKAVAEMAGHFGKPFGAQDVAYYAGLWHDLGKFNPEFQRYLAGDLQRGGDHKGAGARLAVDHLQLIGMLIQGHHGGLKALQDFEGWLKERGETAAAKQSLSAARQAIPDLEPQNRLSLPDFINKSPLGAELWLRMTFSALVDADFLDTEAHFNPASSETRQAVVEIDDLWERFQQRHRERTRNAAGKVNQVRAEVYADCLSAAQHTPGIFRLAVPTGGGKTLSAMGFALRHAAQHDMKRIIVAVPFISITQQTAQEYRDILNDPGSPDSPVVLEHHSGVAEADTEDHDHQQTWQRLASENWDAPIVVTTTVQLFHSLFSNLTSATRKLHNLANSVIILDEAQALPPKMLEPILDALRQLTDHYGTTVVLSTATQPAFETIKPFAGVNAVEITPSYPRHFQQLKRVHYEWDNTTLSWDGAAAMMRERPQALAIVNTKKDALALLDELDAEALHLSTFLCGRHRNRVIAEIKERLRTGAECRVVSTQVVEAGVDLDFPMVLRAVGPLDSIIQAAGRCNREGRDPNGGRVVIFQPAEAAQPPAGSYRAATEITASMRNESPLDPDDLATVAEYFRRLYQNVDTDSRKVQQSRRKLNYPQVAHDFRMIDDDTVPVIIGNYGTAEERQSVSDAIAALRDQTHDGRRLLRRLQPWQVQIYRRQAAELEAKSLLMPVMPGLYEWWGPYDPITGIGGVDHPEPDRWIV